MRTQWIIIDQAPSTGIKWTASAGLRWQHLGAHTCAETARQRLWPHRVENDGASWSLRRWRAMVRQLAGMVLAEARGFAVCLMFHATALLASECDI